MTIYTSDSFGRPDAPINGVNTDIAGGGSALPWSAPSGNFAVISGQLGETTGAGEKFATVDVSVTNMVVSSFFMVLTAGADSIGVVARWVDSNNFYLLHYVSGSLVLSKKVAGVLTTLTTSPLTPVAGDYIELSVNGNVLAVYINSVQVTSIVDSSLSTGTKAGYRSSAAAGWRVVTFSVNTGADPATGTSGTGNLNSGLQCDFTYAPRWPEFIELMFPEVKDDPLGEVAGRIKQVVAILEQRDRDLEDHLHNRPCCDCDGVGGG